MQEKLDYLLEKYAVKATAVLSKDGKEVTIDGVPCPVLAQRQERRFLELKKIVDNTVGAISHFKIMSLYPDTMSIDELLARELDVAEYVGSLHITEIFNAAGDDVCNVCCATAEGPVITLELSVGLPAGHRVIDKHEIITDRGTACDRAVDSQTPLSSLYVYGKKPAEFTDTDFELYGLSEAEIAIVRRAFALAADPTLCEAEQKAAARLAVLVDAAKRSAARGENICL